MQPLKVDREELRQVESARLGLLDCFKAREDVPCEPVSHLRLSVAVGAMLLNEVVRVDRF
jgi:hypothetical protein